MFLSRACLGK
jgi:flagellar biosynthesis GTPase FlhF